MYKIEPRVEVKSYRMQSSMTIITLGMIAYGASHSIVISVVQQPRCFYEVLDEDFLQLDGIIAQIFMDVFDT